MLELRKHADDEEVRSIKGTYVGWLIALAILYRKWKKE